MASKQEKAIVGLPEDATQEKFEATLRDLVAARDLLENGPSGDGGKLLVISRGKQRNRASFVVPAIDQAPLVLDLATLLAEPNGPANYEKLKADSTRGILLLDSRAPLTPANQIQRTKPS